MVPVCTAPLTDLYLCWLILNIILYTILFCKILTTVLWILYILVLSFTSMCTEPLIINNINLCTALFSRILTTVSWILHVHVLV